MGQTLTVQFSLHEAWDLAAQFCQRLPVKNVNAVLGALSGRTTGCARSTNLS